MPIIKIFHNIQNVQPNQGEALVKMKTRSFHQKTFYQRNVLGNKRSPLNVTVFVCFLFHTTRDFTVSFIILKTGQFLQTNLVTNIQGIFPPYIHVLHIAAVIE